MWCAVWGTTQTKRNISSHLSSDKKGDDIRNIKLQVYLLYVCYNMRISKQFLLNSVLCDCNNSSQELCARPCFMFVFVSWRLISAISFRITSLAPGQSYDRPNGPLTRYVKLRVAHAPGMRERFPCHRLHRKPLVSDPVMHHGTCVTHVPWCISGLLTRGGGENVPGIPGACANRDFTYLVRGPYQWGNPEKL